MKTGKVLIKITSIIAISIYLSGHVFAQEELSEISKPEKLDFHVRTVLSDSIHQDKNPLFNLIVEIDNTLKIRPEVFLIKVTKKETHEIYFIRAVDNNLLEGGKDVQKWEKERAERERAIEESRKWKNKKRKKINKNWSGPKYKMGHGRRLLHVTNTTKGPVFKFGPFSPGDYELFVRVEDERKKLYSDRQNITINRELEEEAAAPLLQNR